MEEWKDIEGFPGYQVSNMGYVRSLDRIIKRSNGQTVYNLHLKGIELKQKINGDGYITFPLTNINGKQQYKSLHKILANAFIPNPENKPTVDHINRNKLDNNISNLRWASRSEQCFNRNFPTGKAGEKYITQTRNTFMVHINNINIRVRKGFKTREEAIAYRDSII